MACYNGQDVVVNELIECGANVNQLNEKGFAPLHFTAASRHGALCLELLVCNGADVNIKVRKKILSPCMFGWRGNIFKPDLLSQPHESIKTLALILIRLYCLGFMSE